jgi:deoxycytidylate deaminase
MTRFHYDPTLVFPVGWPSSLQDPVRTVTARITLPNGDSFTETNLLPVESLCVPGVPRAIVRKMATHAEKGAILLALRYYSIEELKGSVIHVSLEPCQDCRDIMELFGISDCYFSLYYIPSDARTCHE